MALSARMDAFNLLDHFFSNSVEEYLSGLVHHRSFAGCPVLAQFCQKRLVGNADIAVIRMLLSGVRDFAVRAYGSFDHPVTSFRLLSLN